MLSTGDWICNEVLRLEIPSGIPYLLDCKPRLIKFFFHHVCGLHSRAAYIFLCDADILSDLSE